MTLKYIYIDIDGVLLQKDQQAAAGLKDFLCFVKQYFECYWLTTHCKGNSQTAVRYLEHHLGEDILPFISHIKSTNWQTSKTEAIDFNAQFFWLDDYVFLFERQVLMENECLDYLIEVDLNRENELKRIITLLKEKLKTA